MSWQEEAVEALQEGRTVQVRPRGHSMTGRINDGDLITLKPGATAELTVGIIVLVRIQGKRFSHVVLHTILEIKGLRYRIGSHQGRIDGWVDRADLYGLVTDGETPS